MGKRLFFLAPLAMLGMLLFITLGTFVVMQLWNWLLPELFGWRALTFWQALGILLLSRILFGGFGLHGSGGSRLRHRFRRRFRQRMKERCAGMTPEEREHFRARMRARWGFGAPHGEGGEDA